MDSLTYKRTNVYETADETLMTEIFDFAEGYKQFLDAGKTERECCAYVEAAAKAAGYEAFDFGRRLKAGDKIYYKMCIRDRLYGDKWIFDDISCGIQENEKIGIIGINGTGKTTLLRIIAGTEEPDKGQVIMQNGCLLYTSYPLAWEPEPSRATRSRTRAAVWERRFPPAPFW